MMTYGTWCKMWRNRNYYCGRCLTKKKLLLKWRHFLRESLIGGYDMIQFVGKGVYGAIALGMFLSLKSKTLL